MSNLPSTSTLIHFFSYYAAQTGTYDLSMAGGRLNEKSFVLAANVRWGDDKFDISRH